MSASEKPAGKLSVTEKLSARLPAISERVDRSPVVAVVKLHGVISPTPTPLARGVINLAAVEPALTRAFGHDRLVAVALAINSPGGAPTQSALVAERIRELAGKHDVPVLAFCEDLAASGGYWLACAGDEIYAHPTSMVGSIGVISAGFGLTGLLDRLGVERRVHTAGKHKVRLDPFRPEKQEDVQWLAGMHRQLHEQFVAWVRQRRGDKLPAELAGNASNGSESNGSASNGSAVDADDGLFTGEVWTGARAVELGLVDGLGTLREIIGERYPDAKITVAEPRKPLLARLGVGGPLGASLDGVLGGSLADRVLAVLDAVEQRASWNRFGL